MDGRRLSFEEIGIWNGVFVMKDRETGSLWSHYTGEALEGPLAGRTLPWVQTGRSQWGRLRAEHPDATVPEKYELNFRATPPASGRGEAMGESIPPAFVPTMPGRDRRLGRHEHGLGLFAAGAHRFYPLDKMRGQPVVNDEVGGVPVVVLLQDGTEAAAAYSRCLDGKTMTMAGAEWEGRRALRSEDGTLWTSEGAATEGPGKGLRLTPIRSMVTDWYGWSAYFPKTTIHEPPKK